MADAPRPPPPRTPVPDDPLSGAFPLRRNLPAFLFSTAFHAVLLVVLATFSFAVVQRDRINVKIDPGSLGDEADHEGWPSLDDVVGSLHPQRFRQAAVRSVAHPSANQRPAASAMRAPEMPRLSGVGPTIGKAPGDLDADIPLSIGGGLVGGGLGGGGFGGEILGLRKTGIDLVVVLDTTGSMQSVLDEVKAEMRRFIADLQTMVKLSRVAVVAYRDRGEEYVVKWVDFSFHTTKVQQFVDGLRADGGGDYEEAVKQGIETAVDELEWRKSARRILILVGGTPPHQAERAELAALLKEFREQNGAVGAIDVTTRLHEEYDRGNWIAKGKVGKLEISPMPEFYRDTTDAYRDITRAGGGELLALGSEKELLRQVMVLTFGKRWRTEMASVMDKLR
jgi:hypothetical protein